MNRAAHSKERPNEEEDSSGVDSDVCEQYDLNGMSVNEFRAMLKTAPAEELGFVTATMPYSPSIQFQNEQAIPRRSICSDAFHKDVLPSSESTAGTLPPELYNSILQGQVDHYIRSHRLMQAPLAPHTTSERRDCSRDVYDYARAKGLSSAQAGVEVRKARKFYEERRIATKAVSNADDIAGRQESLDGSGSDCEGTAWGSEIDDSAEILRAASQMRLSRTSTESTKQPNDDDIMRKALDDGENAGNSTHSRNGEGKREPKLTKQDSRKRSPSNVANASGHKVGENIKSQPTSHSQRQQKGQHVSQVHGQSAENGKKRKRGESKVTESGNSSIMKSTEKPDSMNIRTLTNPTIDPSLQQNASAGDSMENSLNMKQATDNNRQMTDVLQRKEASKNEASGNGMDGKDSTPNKRQKRREQPRIRDWRPDLPSASEVRSLDQPDETSHGKKAHTKTKMGKHEPIEKGASPEDAKSADVLNGEATSHGLPSKPYKDDLLKGVANPGVRKNPMGITKEERKAAKKKRANERKEQRNSNYETHGVKDPEGLESLESSVSASHKAAATAISQNDVAQGKEKQSALDKGADQVTVGVDNNTTVEHAPEKGPNDPANEEEAHLNYLKAQERDPHESEYTAGMTREQIQEQEKKDHEFVSKLSSLKRFSNEKQLQAFDGGAYEHADKQTKDDLKGLKEEKKDEQKFEEMKKKRDIEDAKKKMKKKKKGESKTKRITSARRQGAVFSQSDDSPNMSGVEGLQCQKKSSQLIGHPSDTSKSPSVGIPNQQDAVRPSNTNSYVELAPSHLRKQHLESSRGAICEPQTKGTSGVIFDIPESNMHIEDVSSLSSSPLSSPPSTSAELSDPFESETPHKISKTHSEPTEALVCASSKVAATPSPLKRRRSALKSPYFKPSTPSSWAKKKRPPRGTVSCVPFPPLHTPVFGLIQEKLAHDPFKLLVAVTFLNRTKGIHAIPVFYDLLEHYPTPSDLAGADLAAVSDIIRHLGLQNQRAKRYIFLAQMWVDDPPVKGRRHRGKLNYPNPGDGKDIKPSEILADEDDRAGAWEIAHLPSAGPYALDSWRIFCRDKLRGLASGWNGEDANEPDFEPEWKRVLPKDKELRAFLRWMWLRQGWEWCPLTGAKELASEELLERARKGDIVWEVMDDGVLEKGRDHDEKLALPAEEK
ncbi:MAG: hypothetical protein M1827_003086 [Pycnora praestabilis]|nr:MAG: hypothetical protein M1827_003086 [Pycnora praestabilis]